ncbi:MAG: RNA helicase, partial [Thauera sp.]|nr:RNA helicase [Thauera sp.]
GGRPEVDGNRMPAARPEVDGNRIATQRRPDVDGNRAAPKRDDRQGQGRRPGPRAALFSPRGGGDGNR